MQVKTIVDTSAIIAYLRKESPGEIVVGLLKQEAIIVPAVCIFELLAGVKSERHIQQRRQLLDLSEIAKIDREISEKAAELFTVLRSKGITIDNEDLLIAASAISHNFPLLTVNKKHFSYIANLDLVK